MELDRIRQKVWAGEALTQDELELLRRAAGEDGGPVLRTTVAQALINADFAQQAIPLLEAVRRDFPSDAQAHLALGRALVSLERWSEAQAPLERALELNPDDPEALKALAVLALRRGEWRRARAWIDTVLQLDPFDGEAQALSNELDQATPAELREPPSVGEFTRALVTALASQSTPHLLQRSDLLVRLGGRGRGVARIDVASLHEEFLRSGRPLEEAVAVVARELAERVVGMPPSKVHLLAKVLPVVRDAAFLEHGVGAARREGPAGLFIYYVMDDPELARYVPEGLLGAWRTTLEQLDEAAWRNLAARSTPVRAIELERGALRLSTEVTGLWALAQGDGHDAARLLTASHQAELEHALGPGPWRVYLGLRELVLLARLADVASVRKLDGLDAAREGIAGAWQLHEGRLTALPEWEP